MQRDPKSMIIVAASLVVLAVASKLFIPRDLPWRIPGGWPFGSHYYRYDQVAFSVLFGAGIVAAFVALLRTMLRA
jgi:hypothetical protein